MLQLVYVLQSSGESDEAQKLASAALTLAQDKGMQTLVARGLVDLGTVYFTAKNFTEAEKYIRQALEYAQRYKARRSEARAMFMFGNLRITQGQIDEGVGYIEQARNFYKQNGFRVEESRAVTLLARANRSKGNYDAALQAFRELLQLAEQSNDNPQKALSHEGIASVLIRRSIYLEALDHYRMNYEINKTLNSTQGIRYGLLNQAYVLLQLGYYNDARNKLIEALPASEQAKPENKSAYSEYLVAAADIDLSQRKLSDAKSKAEEALKLLGDKVSTTLVDAKLVLGTTMVLTGAKRDGRQLCEQALVAATTLGDPWVISIVRQSLAEALLAAGDDDGALKNALQAQENFGRSEQYDWEWRSWLTAALASHGAEGVIKSREYAANANNALTKLQQKLGPQAFESYSQRTDMQTSQKLLRELIAK